MKKIRNIFFTILMFSIVFIVYYNIDFISFNVRTLLVNNDKVILKDNNIYTRSYNYISFNYKEDYIPYSEDDIINIYFNILNNGWDDFTFYCPEEYKSCLSDIEVIGKDEKLMSKINNYVHPYNSFKTINTTISNMGSVNVKVSYKYSKDMISSINSKVNDILSILDIDSISNDRDKIELIHNYIIDNTIYDSEGAKDNSNSLYDSTSAYGALIEGYAVCSGYSDAMSIFLDILDIPNLKISSVNHVWNLVYLDNKWLHLDLTWDDTDIDKYKSNYFLISKEKLFSLDTKEHVFDEDFFIEGR